MGSSGVSGVSKEALDVAYNKVLIVLRKQLQWSIDQEYTCAYRIAVQDSLKKVNKLKRDNINESIK